MKKIIFISFYLLMVLLLMFGFIVHHEEGHKKIMLYHTCAEAKINYNIIESTTKCLIYKNFNNTTIDYQQKVYLQEYYLHAQHETVGYHLQALTLSILIGIFFLLINNR